VRVGGRALEVVHLPAAEVGAADVPRRALAVRGQDERALPCPHEHPHSAHTLAPLFPGFYPGRPRNSPARPRGQGPPPSLYSRTAGLAIDTWLGTVRVEGLTSSSPWFLGVSPSAPAMRELERTARGRDTIPRVRRSAGRVTSPRVPWSSRAPSRER